MRQRDPLAQAMKDIGCFCLHLYERRTWSPMSSKDCDERDDETALVAAD